MFDRALGHLELQGLRLLELGLGESSKAWLELKAPRRISCWIVKQGLQARTPFEQSCR